MTGAGPATVTTTRPATGAAFPSEYALATAPTKTAYLCGADITSAPGYTVDDFNKVNAKTRPPQDLDGLINWAAGADASGLQAVAVCESKAQAERYAAEQMFPAFQEFGLEGRHDADDRLRRGRVLTPVT